MVEGSPINQMTSFFGADDLIEYKEINFIDTKTIEVLQLDISVFNVLKNVFGDSFSSAVDRHTASVIENIANMEEALKNNNAESVEHAVHSLKGASGQFGAIALSKFAKQMEILGKNNEVEKVKDIISLLTYTRKKVEKLMLAK